MLYRYSVACNVSWLITRCMDRFVVCSNLEVLGAFVLFALIKVDHQGASCWSFAMAVFLLHLDKQTIACSQALGDVRFFSISGFFASGHIFTIMHAASEQIVVCSNDMQSSCVHSSS